MNDLAEKTAKQWLENAIPEYLNLIHGEYMVEALSNQLKIYVKELDKEDNMTAKLDIKMADIKFRRDQIAKERDRLREVFDSLEYDLEVFDGGIEVFDQGIELMEMGLDQISEVV